MVPFLGTWTGNNGAAVEVQTDGTVSIFDQTTFTTWTGTYVQENGQNRILFTDEEGNQVVGTLSEDGTSIDFMPKDNPIFQTWNQGVVDVADTTTTAWAVVGTGATIVMPDTTTTVAPVNPTTTMAPVNPDDPTTTVAPVVVTTTVPPVAPEATTAQPSQASMAQLLHKTQP